jgi:DNA (cytosine-5)-methyltransferase 1
MAGSTCEAPRRPPALPLLSLFCGAGGLDLGFEQAGFEPLLALDIDEAAVDTYNWNRPDKSNPARIADLSDQEAPKTVLRWWEERAGAAPVGIIGGPPCQAFSISNARQQPDDPRARLLLCYAGILKAFNERYEIDFFVFENVTGLLRQPHKLLFDKFLKTIQDAGFSPHIFSLDAVHFGVAQRRKRLFIAGINHSRYRELQLVPPQGDQRIVTVREVIGQLPEPVRYVRNGDPRGQGVHANHWCLNPKSTKFTNGSLQPGKYLGRSFRMLRWDAPSWTVAYGHREVHVHPNGHRRLSVYEAMLLQGFPPEYELRGTMSDQIRLVSYAVPPPVARALAQAIADALGYPACGTDGVAGECTKAHHGDTGQPAQAGLFGVQAAAPKSTSA